MLGHLFLLLLQLADLLLDRGFLLPEVETLISQILNVVNLVVFWIQPSNALVIIFFVLLLRLLFRCFIFLVALLILGVVSLLLFWLLTTDVELLVECSKLGVFVRSRWAKFVESALKVGLLLLNVVDFLLFLL